MRITTGECQQTFIIVPVERETGKGPGKAVRGEESWWHGVCAERVGVLWNELTGELTW